MSESEPEARPQHESNGGWGLGYNAQLATDAKEKIVVGVELTNNASDAGQLTPTLDRFERTPKQVLADGGYANQANIEALAAAEIEYADAGAGAGQGLEGGVEGGGNWAALRAEVFHLRRGDGHVSVSGPADLDVSAIVAEAEAQISAVSGKSI